MSPLNQANKMFLLARYSPKKLIYLAQIKPGRKVEPLVFDNENFVRVAGSAFQGALKGTPVHERKNLSNAQNTVIIQTLRNTILVSRISRGGFEGRYLRSKAIILFQSCEELPELI